MDDDEEERMMGSTTGTGRKGWTVGRWVALSTVGFMTIGGLAVADLAANDGDVRVEVRRGSEEAFAWRGPMPAGGVLEIKGVNGSVHAVRAAGSEVVVTATIRGRRSDPATVRVERVEHDGGITFCAVYPTPSGSDENVCAPGDEGHMSTRRNDVEVEFRVEVPSGVPFHGRTVNGSVEAAELESDVVAKTVNGAVEVSTTGSARARTVNGSIEARMGNAPTGEVDFETVNGRISLDFPDDVDADLDVRWLNGGLDSELPITLGRMGRGHATGTLGQGGPTIRIKTVNGSIRIR
ncbi:MAG: hypothetical protein WEA34_07245 [Gemmatimonadota bacterium]